ncbi:hypothetical protein ACX84A_30290, partial [Burkholderia pseudomallei]
PRAAEVAAEVAVAVSTEIAAEIATEIVVEVGAEIAAHVEIAALVRNIADVRQTSSPPPRMRMSCRRCEATRAFATIFVPYRVRVRRAPMPPTRSPLRSRSSILPLVAR